MCFGELLYARKLCDAYRKGRASTKRSILDISEHIQRRRVRPFGFLGHVLHVKVSGLFEILVDIY